jgi:hypothetical protein
MKLHMVAWSRFSTSTVIDSEYLVPWLSAEGPLAYSPTKPPARDYFFQYSWILPGIFNPQINLREHRYFGCSVKDRGLVWRRDCGVPTPWSPIAELQRQLCHSRLLAAEIFVEFVVPRRG